MISCEFCNLIVSKPNYSKHKKTELCKNIKNTIEQCKNNDLLEIDNLKQQLNQSLRKTEEEKKKVFSLEIKLNECVNKSEEYRKIIENYNTKNNFKLPKQNEIDTTFQIDINLNNKQLNKTKFKDVPEEQVIKDIHSLKLKDNYQLEYREEDGFINITNLCKAGGKEFKNWNKNEKTKRFLEVLSSTVLIRTVELLKQEQGGNGERHTWAHPQVAINIAQWISPEFDVLVSKWVYEIMLTGKVDIKDNKTTQELDKMNKENKLLKNRVKLLESKVLQKQPRETFENGKNVIYIVTTEYKEAQGHYKIGKAKDLKERMSVYNTTDTCLEGDKHEVIYYTNCKTKKKMDILEQLVHDKLEDKRIEPNKEWFLSEEDAEDFIKIIEECKKIVDN
jgi:hypothetical protein